MTRPGPPRTGKAKLVIYRPLTAEEQERQVGTWTCQTDRLHGPVVAWRSWGVIGLLRPHDGRYICQPCLTTLLARTDLEVVEAEVYNDALGYVGTEEDREAAFRRRQFSDLLRRDWKSIII